MRNPSAYPTSRNARVAAALVIILLLTGLNSCSPERGRQGKAPEGAVSDHVEAEDPGQNLQPGALLVSPRHPKPGQPFRILSAGGRKILKSGVEVTGPSGSLQPVVKSKGEGYPCWRVDEFMAPVAGNYRVRLEQSGSSEVKLDFEVTESLTEGVHTGRIWRSSQGWDASWEALYAAWISALFNRSDERSSWTSLHSVMQQRDANVLHNHLGHGEDEPDGKSSVVMEPDCADNPFFLRAYFAWKNGLPFGYHECDRGWLGKAPRTGNWITSEGQTSRKDPVQAFNALMRRLMDGVHSGTARTALSDQTSDYYPVALTRESLRPGTVFADPYGHTLILVKWIPAKGDKPGILLSVDAQPDGTVAIKRFWKGNFLFTTKEVVGEPGFKAFRPIRLENGHLHLMKDEEIGAMPGMVPVSLQQKNLDAEAFYRSVDRCINPKPLDPETALSDLIAALHEQLLVRVNSVGTGETYMKDHPGTVVSMPGKASGVFLAGGQWEDFSTPNRDLRLLIAMDAVIGFPERVARFPGDFKLSGWGSADQAAERLNKLLLKKSGQLEVTYERSDGTRQTLTMTELLNRRDAFEMGYNPNDCPEIRWGAPEGSSERSTCRRQAPEWQRKKMEEFRVWFRKRLHPPT